MLDISTEFKNAILNDNRNFLPFLDITLTNGTVLNLSNKNVWQNSFSIEDATSASGKFTIGAAVTSQLRVTLNNIYDDFSEYDFAKAQVVAYVGLQLSNTLEKVRVGTFTVDDPSYDGATISLSNLDGMTKFDRPYSESTLAYPATVQAIVNDACTYCGVPLLSVDFPNRGYVVKSRPADEALTFGDIIAMCAQLAGCWAKMDPYGRLKLDWYKMSIFEQNAKIDGGKLDSVSPYATGDVADGGNFTNYTAGGSNDGGTFDNQKRYHHIFSTKSLSVSTDDVVITGVRVTEEFEETDTQKKGTFLAGVDGFIVEIAGNAQIQQGQAQAVAEYLYSCIGGMTFRQLDVECLTDPSIEAGDIAYVTDRKQNTYQIFISSRTFNLGGSEHIVCDVETPMKNSMKQFSDMTKAVVKARNEAQAQLSNYDLAIQQLTSLMTQSFGIFKTEEVLDDGSTVYYMHNKPELATSSIIWKMTADAFAVSTDGGHTWNAGIDAQGNAVVNVLNAIGINADWINAGTISSAEINIGKNAFKVDSNGNVTITKGSIDIGSGKFTVDRDGNLIAENAQIKGKVISSKITSSSIDNGNGTFSVDTNGKVVASNAEITGKLIGLTEMYIRNPIQGIDKPVIRYKWATEDSRYQFLSPDGEVFMYTSQQMYPLYFPLVTAFNKIKVLGFDKDAFDFSGTDDSKISISGKIYHSGVFVSVTGTADVNTLHPEETVTATILSSDTLWLPNHRGVKTIVYTGTVPVSLTINTNGTFTAKNCGSTMISESGAFINFRFDYTTI